MFKLQLTDQYDRYDGVQWSHQPGLRITITITIHYNQTHANLLRRPLVTGKKDVKEKMTGATAWSKD